MEVILREDIERLGNRGQVVKVADGYARNFLLPKRLAVAATDANRKIVEQERQAHLRREAKQKSEAEDLAKLVSGVTLTIAQKAGENDQLFGSVTAKDVADALAQKNYTIDRRKVILEEPIKMTFGGGPIAVASSQKIGISREDSKSIRLSIFPNPHVQRMKQVHNSTCREPGNRSIKRPNSRRERFSSRSNFTGRHAGQPGKHSHTRP